MDKQERESGKEMENADMLLKTARVLLSMRHFPFSNPSYSSSYYPDCQFITGNSTFEYQFNNPNNTIPYSYYPDFPVQEAKMLMNNKVSSEPQGDDQEMNGEKKIWCSSTKPLYGFNASVENNQAIQSSRPTFPGNNLFMPAYEMMGGMQSFPSSSEGSSKMYSIPMPASAEVNKAPGLTNPLLQENNLNRSSEQSNDYVKDNEGVEKRNRCNICDKVYARPSTLQIHLRTHTGEKPYKCCVCDKSFGQNANLKAHLRIHTGDKPFQCTLCKRRFAQSSSVTTHMRVHSGQRPYKCRICTRGFTDSSTLTKHLQTHTGEKPYRCQQCGMTFSQSGNLSRHLRVHSKHFNG